MRIEIQDTYDYSGRVESIDRSIFTAIDSTTTTVSSGGIAFSACFAPLPHPVLLGGEGEGTTCGNVSIWSFLDCWQIIGLT